MIDQQELDPELLTKINRVRQQFATQLYKLHIEEEGWVEPGHTGKALIDDPFPEFDRQLDLQQLAVQASEELPIEEYRVCSLLASDLGSDEVAGRLGITQYRVNALRARASRKLPTSLRIEASKVLDH